MKIGDKVFYFDRNKFPKRDAQGMAIYRDYFREITITAETETSWITGGGKFPKKPKSEGTPETYSHCDRLFTAADVDNVVFVHDNRHAIADRLRQCNDADALRKVREILEAAK